MSEKVHGAFGPIGQKVTTISLAVVVWAQYFVLIGAMLDMSHLHHLKAAVWLLAIIYLLPWMIGIGLGRQIRTRVAEGAMSTEAALYCNVSTNLMLISAYALMTGFAQLHTR